MTCVAEISCFISVGQTAQSKPSFNATEAFFSRGVVCTNALRSISPIQDEVSTVQLAAPGKVKSPPACAQNKQIPLTPRSLPLLMGQENSKDDVAYLACYVVRPNRLVTYMRGGGMQTGPGCGIAVLLRYAPALDRSRIWD